MPKDKSQLYQEAVNRALQFKGRNSDWYKDRLKACQTLEDQIEGVRHLLGIKKTDDSFDSNPGFTQVINALPILPTRSKVKECELQKHLAEKKW